MKTVQRSLRIPVPTLLDLLHRSSPVARAARVRGNAAGVHGGKKAHYGAKERQRARREERAAYRQGSRCAD